MVSDTPVVESLKGFSPTGGVAGGGHGHETSTGWDMGV